MQRSSNAKLAVAVVQEPHEVMQHTNVASVNLYEQYMATATAQGS